MCIRDSIHLACKFYDLICFHITIHNTPFQNVILKPTYTFISSIHCQYVYKPKVLSLIHIWAEEAQKRQDEKRKQEAEKTEALFEAMLKQMQEHTTAELGLLCGDLGELTL